MDVKKININQSELTYNIASDIYDVSAHNDDVTFASLSELLSSENLYTLIPTALRCGGMTIRFVQSSDNKYVQYRLMSATFSTTESDWQGVDDEPTAGSDNLVKSGGVFSSIRETEAAINGTKSLVIYKTHLDNIKGGTPKRIPFKVIGQGEILTLKVKNSQIEYNGQEPKGFAVTFVKNNGEYTSNILYNDGEKSIINNDEIKYIAINTNIGIESLSLDIEVTNGDVIADIEYLKKYVSTYIDKLIYQETFNLNSSNMTNYKIDKKFKAGDVISLIVKNFNFDGYGEYNVAVKDSTNTLIYVNNKPPKNDIFDNIIIPSDTDSLIVFISYEASVTSMNGDFIISIDQTKSIISGKRVDLIGAFSYVTHLSLDDRTYIELPFNYKAGQPLTFKVSNYSTQSATDAAHNINLYYNNKVLAVLYTNGEKNVILEDNANVLFLRMGTKGDVTSFEADVEILYGGFSRAYIEQNDLNAKIEVAETKLNIINTPLDLTPYSTSINGNITDWVWMSSAYIGLNTPFETDCILKSFSIDCFEADKKDNIGELFEFVVGIIDQRGWLLPRITFTKPIYKINHQEIFFNFEEDKIVAKEGEVFFIKMHHLSELNVLCGLSSSTYDANKIVKYTTDLKNALSSYSDKGFSVYNIEVLNIDTIFPYKDDVKNIENSISTIQSQITNIKTYVDDITGDKYLIKVSNGQLILQSLKIDNMLVIGHSYVHYGNSPAADWYLDDGENRAMAPTINAHQWTEFIKSKIDCTIKIKGGVNFERNYSPDYDFASNWNIQDNYDAICIYLNENAVYNDTMQASWEAMLNYLKSAAPRARIFCTGSWTAGAKEKAIRAACINVNGINYVDCLGLYTTEVNASTIWKKGDYYFGRESQYYPMGAPNSHPNDVGHLYIANRFLQSFGEDIVSGNTYNIALNQAVGGTIETPNAIWVENGIVTIRCNPSEGYVISSVNAQKESGSSIETVRRTNTMFDGTERVYYTFTMPNENVSVTPIWTTEQL